MLLSLQFPPSSCRPFQSSSLGGYLQGSISLGQAIAKYVYMSHLPQKEAQWISTAKAMSEDYEHAYFALNCETQHLLKAAISWRRIRVLRLCRNRLRSERGIDLGTEQPHSLELADSLALRSEDPDTSFGEERHCRPPELVATLSTSLADLPSEVYDMLESYILLAEATYLVNVWPFSPACICSPALLGWRLRGIFEYVMDAIRVELRLGNLQFSSLDQFLFSNDIAVSRLRRVVESSQWFDQAVESMERIVRTDGCTLCWRRWFTLWEHLSLNDEVISVEVSRSSKSQMHTVSSDMLYCPSLGGKIFRLHPYILG